MNHKIHGMNTCYSTRTIGALSAVQNGKSDMLIFNRDFSTQS